MDHRLVSESVSERETDASNGVNKIRVPMTSSKSIIKPNRCQRPAGLPQLVLFVLALCSFELADSLRFTSIQMPALVQRGTNFWLSCQYELAAGAPVTTSSSSSSSAVSPLTRHASDSRTGNDNDDDSGPIGAGTIDEQLYSVKWYKNNEEFYRLIFASGTTGPSQQPQVGGGEQQWSPSGPVAGVQQQYFTQPGVNVLMSSSNATHVRLLNASLESDGSYACEISTQNLSTIRFEKEIKVYVLPNSKLNLIGLRGFYSLGERVELNCLSDFSRPVGALSWFINGRRVITTTTTGSTQNARNFLLGPQLTKPKANEPKLVRSSLTLKFKLTNEILAAAASSGQTLDLFERLANNASGSGVTGGNNADSSSQTTTTTTSNKRNQSKLLLLKSYNINEHQQKQQQQQLDARRLGASGLRLVELLRLECRYKLTEVSDVTFSELRVASSELPAPTSGVDGSRPAVAVELGGDQGSSSLRRRRPRRQSRRTPPHEMSQRRRAGLGAPADQQLAAVATGAAVTASNNRSNNQHHHRLTLTKSLTNQVLQSSCPARRDELLARLSRASQSPSSCRLGLLALQREDPVILESQQDQDEVKEEEAEAADEELEERSSLGEDGRSALNGREQRRMTHSARSGGWLELPVGSSMGVNCSTLGALSSSLSPPPPVRPPVSRSSQLRTKLVGDGGGGFSGDQSERSADSDEQSVIYCSDIEARRRLLISGKYQQMAGNAGDQHWGQSAVASPNQRPHKTVSLQQQQQHNNKRHHVAYVSFETTTTTPSSSSGQGAAQNNNGRRQQARLGPDHGDKLSLSNFNGAADSSNFLQLDRAKSLVQLHNNAATELDTNNNYMQQSDWLAPPLLEWFINNQEAPKSSASYWPELPLTPSSERQEMAAPPPRPQQPSPYADQLEEPTKTGEALDEAPQTTTVPQLLPSIDYREYFANFDMRTNDPHLMLKLILEKKHFMTADSLLRLRCTSTQAQVLAIDSLDVSIYAIPPGAINPMADPQNNPQQQQQHEQMMRDLQGNHRPASSIWQQRQPSSQIKSKYLHRQQQQVQAKSSPAGGHDAASDGKYQQLLGRTTQASNGSMVAASLPSNTAELAYLVLIAIVWIVVRC